MFDVNFYSRKNEFHRYSTEDLALLTIGLGSYNKSSVEEFFNAQKPNPDVVEFFEAATGVAGDQIRGKGIESTMEILEFDIIDKVYKSTKGLTEINKLNQQKFPPTKFTPPAENTIIEFLEKWNQVQIGAISDSKIVNGYKAVIDKIHNSMSGCILFKATFNVLGDQRKADIRLVPTYSRDNESSRTMSFRGAPLISTVPQTAEGLRYGFRQTNEAGVGSYIGPLEGGVDNPQNTVAGNLRLTYDPTTGEYESGTQQILVRLIDDIDPADVSNMTGEDLLSATPDQVYNGPESDLFMGGFTKGRGVPLSMENGNPHMYGPNFKGGCTNSSQKSIITVVNRAAQSFKSGRLVMCSKINGEWIILPTGEGDTQKKLTFGNFEYGQYLMPINSLFAITYGSNPTRRYTPQIIEQLIRSKFYIELKFDTEDLESTNDIDEIKLLNMYSSTIPDGTEDPVQYLNENYDEDEARELLQEADTELNNSSIEALIEGVERFVQYPGSIKHDSFNDFSEITNALPKNVDLKSARSFTLSGSDNEEILIYADVEDPLYGDEVPFFWGMLFPDGYKTDGTAKFIAANKETFKNNPLFDGDKNLKELSVLSTIGFPDLKDDYRTLRFIINRIRNMGNSLLDKYGDTSFSINPLNYVKKTCGMYSYSRYSSELSPSPFYTALSRFESLNQDGSIIPDKHIFGLEPVKPGRIQFSSMSIEHLYSKSLLLNDKFTHLYQSREYYDPKYFRNGTPPALSVWQSPTFNDYLYDWWGEGRRDEEFVSESSEDDGNAYNIQQLSADYILNSSRHPSPLGVCEAVPSLYSYKKPLIIPILTCKSKVRTNASSLSFEVNQLLGMVKKQTVSPANINEPIILPIGAGLAWQNPDTGISINSFPQWGDRNRTDDYDSLGTSALHVRIFEGWPIDQTVYHGHMFTPLHYNPRPQHEFAEEIVYNEDGGVRVVNSLDNNGFAREARSSVDFRVPCKTGGAVAKEGEIMTQENTAPIAEWVWNKVRRGKLLTKGGFAYAINYIGIDKDSISKKKPGKGYSVGDIFLYPDGTEVEVTTLESGENEGEEDGIGEIEIREGSNGITSVFTNLQPSYLGSGGSGAEFNHVVFKVKKKYGLDLAPKEVGPITRLTKPSNNGEDMVQGTISTIIDLQNETNSSKEYDVFYFYHNDPTHYSIDRTLAFNGAWAQYAIVNMTAVQ